MTAQRDLFDVEYDGQKDLAGSINEGFRVIRERMKQGGPGWTRRQAYQVIDEGIREIVQSDVVRSVPE